VGGVGGALTPPGPVTRANETTRPSPALRAQGVTVEIFSTLAMCLSPLRAREGDRLVRILH
jgi:hypothetical protein